MPPLPCGPELSSELQPHCLSIALGLELSSEVPFCCLSVVLIFLLINICPTDNLPLYPPWSLKVKPFRLLTL